MNRFFRTKDGSSIDLVGVGVIVVLCIVIGFVVQQVVPVVSLYKHPPKEAVGTRSNDDANHKYAETLAWDRDQVKNRSLFFIPVKPDDKPSDGPKPTTYGGPSLSMFVNGTAYFSDGQKVSAAEPDAKTVHFVRADPPWSVRVRWNRGEFDVPIFEKIQLSSLTSSLAGTFPNSGSSHSSPGASSPDKPAGATSTDGKANPPTETPQPPPPMTNGGGGPAPGGGDPPPPPPPGSSPSTPPSPPPGEPTPPSAPPAGTPPPPTPGTQPAPTPSPSPEPARPPEQAR